MNKSVVPKITSTVRFVKENIFWFLLVLDTILVIATLNNAWYYVQVSLFICLQLIIMAKLQANDKKYHIKNFMPVKTDSDGIRYLRGKRAKEYETVWEATNTYLKIGMIRRFFLDIRLFIVKLTGLPKDYFIERHKYNPESRRALDRFALTNFELRTKHIPDAYYSRWRKLFYKYLKFKYRKEDKRFVYWIRMTSHAKRPIYVWHEDINKYKIKHDIRERTEDEQNEFERRLINH